MYTRVRDKATYVDVHTDRYTYIDLQTDRGEGHTYEQNYMRMDETEVCIGRTIRTNELTCARTRQKYVLAMASS